MENLNYLIIGQGIAGSLFAHFLLKRGKSIRIVDQLNPNSSSRVAAGIFNPITGRRFVKTWMADEIFPFAEKTYREIEKQTGQKFYHPKTIIRTLSDDAEKKEWEKKSKRPDYLPYMKPGIINEGLEKVEILNGGNVDLLAFLKAMHEAFRKSNVIIEENFDFDDLKFMNEFVNWKNFHTEKVIFCEGIRAMQNPWFGHLPFTHAKGEILTIESESLSQDEILSKGIFVLPIGNKQFKVGSTYDWDDLTETPTDKGKNELTDKLEKLIGMDYRIVAHQAGIRPTVRDRWPLIGMHPEFSQLGIFNGLGTKGVSLGPYLANHFVEHLEDGNELDVEVDIERFAD